MYKNPTSFGIFALMCNRGTLRKMTSENADVVRYWLSLDKSPVLELNKLVGSEINLEWTGLIHCINCGRSINKTFGQGFCYPCFRDAPQAAPCIMRPELCEAHLGKGRNVEWEEAHHNQPHIIYIAQTSDIKVGVTRATQVPTRWIDQGAWRAVPIAQVPYRQMAGVIEVELKQFISDRTDWRKMLTGLNSDQDIVALRDELIEFLPDEIKQYALKEEKPTEFSYPVLAYPNKVRSIDLDKHKRIQQQLVGIRGQYLIFGEGQVINLRKYSGYEVALNCQV